MSAPEKMYTLLRRKRNALYTAFCAIMAAAMLLPLLLTCFGADAGQTERESALSRPTLSVDGGVNVNYLSDMGQYYSQSFALRPQLMTANSALRRRLFMTSDVPGVVAGSDGWLYYSDTLGDWLGSGQLSERQIFNIVNDLSLTQRRVNELGCSFLFTIAPNKASLYGEHMPYYYPPCSAPSANAAALIAGLSEAGVSSSDLFPLFDGADEPLYLKNDSHWNNKGAAMVCRRLVEQCGSGFFPFDIESYVTEPYPAGDLYQMLCPVGSLNELNQTYADVYAYRLESRTGSVEDAMITTACPQAAGSLLMYRDSFGNSMIPFLAQSFGSAAFFRTTPYNIESHISLYQPDVVIIEKVERSLDELQLEPPVVSAPTADDISPAGVLPEGAASIFLSEAEANAMYMAVSGSIDEKYLATDTPVLLSLQGEGCSGTYEAFTVTNPDGSQGYVMYLPIDSVFGDVTVSVILGGEQPLLAASANFSV